MSGIVGIFGRNGKPADRQLLQCLVDFLAYRGPDARETWADGSVALGHALLRTTHESLVERQPASLDRQFWITADARIDCRSDLEVELNSKGRGVKQTAPDSELILHAYAAWGEACVQHLRGDFAFAIWDARRGTLFCARDHFGVKPFYYAELGELFLFSNTLDCIRAHPDVSDELNDSAIADFLLFGLNCDNAATTFRDIRRLPPAHFLSVSAAGLRTGRYWSPPVDGRTRYRRPAEYVEHFQALLQSSVSDRVHANRAGIFLSGGLDSSAIAATARGLSVTARGPVDLRAYTVTYESSFADRDGEFARKVADFLGMPIRCLPADDLQLFERWNDPERSAPEPVDEPFFSGLFDQFGAVAADCRVVLSGEGVDNLMCFEMWPYARDLWRNREWKRLATDVSRYLAMRQFPWLGIRRRVQRLIGKDPYAPLFPRWMAPDFAKRVDAQTRWSDFASHGLSSPHPVVPKAHASMSSPLWSRLFETENAGVTRCPVEVRYPFLDLRIVNYVLSLPPFPWSFRKTLLRESMTGHLPDSVRLRRKTPLAGDPLLMMLQRPEASRMMDEAQVGWGDAMEQYVNRAALPPLRGRKTAEFARVAIRPLCLNFWLQTGRVNRCNIYSEARNGKVG